ncbi:hypothetical protein EBT25_04280, partial [bacterium]|nr:hypothetical protein [bacterium]
MVPKNSISWLREAQKCVFFILSVKITGIYGSKKEENAHFVRVKKTIKKGTRRGLRRYRCNACGHIFYGQRREVAGVKKNILEDYIFHKQTYTELLQKYEVRRKELQHIVESFCLLPKIHFPRPIHLIVDATYFGTRKDGSVWCALVARDPERKENLTWMFADTETTYGYFLLKEELERLGYTVLSVTGDGFSGIRSAFHGIPFQMCHVHMERLVIEGTTRKPLTEAGQVLLALVRTLHNYTNSHFFVERLRQFTERYRDFLNEKT